MVDGCHLPTNSNGPQTFPSIIQTVPFTEYGYQPSTWLADKNTKIELPSTNEISKERPTCDASDPDDLDSKGIISSLSLVESRRTSDDYFFRGIVDQSCSDNDGPCERSLSQGTE
jgi:hypothetical protein